ncbi:hypothetical protein [Deinococcus navajonensis]|uniref:Uncharacterized protein n=1 Tax=Deinococcus navajonensis TaxID=309884 RepID=A0ABV8XJI0_9DEIO
MPDFLPNVALPFLDPADAAPPGPALQALVNRAHLWLAHAAEPISAPDIRALVAHREVLPPRLRLLVGEALVQGGRIAEGLAVVRSVPVDRDNALEAPLVLARV